MSPGMIEGYTRQDLLFRCVSCKKDVTDLRLLPCVHTVCLECLQKAGHGKVAGEEIACPQCEEGFKIPPDGLAGIQKNFVIQKLQYIGKLQPETSCEFCSNDSSIDPNKPPGNTQEIPPEIPHAVVYCVECEHKICERCREAHKKVKTSRNHRFVDLGNKSEIEKLTRSIPQSYCDQHPTEVLRIFCKSCQLPVCHVCFEDGHTSHKFSTIEKAGNSFRKKMSCQLEDNLDFFGNFRVQISKIEHQMDEIRENGRQVEEEIKWRADALKEIITHHSELLINEAKSHIDKRLKTMKGLLDTIKMRESMLHHLDNYTKVMTPNVTDAEMCRAFSDINDRFNVLKEDPDEIPTMFNRLFLKQSLLEERWGIYENNIIGKIAGEWVPCFICLGVGC